MTASKTVVLASYGQGMADGIMLAANPPNGPVLTVESLFKKRSVHGESLVGPLVGAVLDTP